MNTRAITEEVVRQAAVLQDVIADLAPLSTRGRRRTLAWVRDWIEEEEVAAQQRAQAEDAPKPEQHRTRRTR